MKIADDLWMKRADLLATISLCSYCAMEPIHREFPGGHGICAKCDAGIEAVIDKYEVWVACGLTMVPWARTGGVPGPMSKAEAESYAAALLERAGVHAEARKVK